MIMKALVTGASSGIGQALKDCLESRGWNVFNFSRSNDLDVRKLADWYKVIEWGKFDLMVLNAGVAYWEEEPGGKEVEILETNVLGVYYGLALAEHLVNDGGVIGVIGSVAGIVPQVDIPLYSATKSAVRTLALSYAKKYWDRYRVVCINPGFVRDTGLGGGSDENFIKEVEKKLPAGRVAKPGEMARWIVWVLLGCRYLYGEITLSGGEDLGIK
jgi:NAD(P)-dependent dehydrogenase (short-subunit alcohol dehydrogenase family)